MKAGNIIEDRKQQSLIRYFHRYSKEARAAVKTISMNLYSPYISVVKAFFPNAKIVIDRFHIVQLLNNTINSMWIAVMNEIKKSRPTDYQDKKKLVSLVSKTLLIFREKLSYFIIFNKIICHLSIFIKIKYLIFI
ncbi:ISL3 family transposase [Mammaliicoccus fleurettii]|uniref:ISL3 family transposase n=1 Tax=Mammaliicoccus fleurettii TaxID=150056 RepID=UPI00398B35A3